MALDDFHAKQPVETLDAGDVVVGVLDSANTRISPLTDTQLRATAVPVSGPLTDAELRAAAVPMSAASLPLPSGAATEATLGNVLAALGGGSVAIADYLDSSLAGGATANHDYTNATGNTLRLNTVCCASTTAASYYVQIDPTGIAGYTTKWVAFTSESSPAFVLDISNFRLASGGKVRIIKKNMAAAATVYSVHTTINADY